MHTQNINELKSAGFVLDNAEKEGAIGCVALRRSTPFYYYNPNFVELSKIRNLEEFHEKVKKADEALLVGEHHVNHGEFPFVILSENAYNLYALFFI